MDATVIFRAGTDIRILQFVRLPTYEAWLAMTRMRNLQGCGPL